MTPHQSAMSPPLDCHRTACSSPRHCHLNATGWDPRVGPPSGPAMSPFAILQREIGMHLRLTKPRRLSIFMELAHSLTFTFSHMLFAISQSLNFDHLSFANQCVPSDLLQLAHRLSRSFSLNFPRELCLRGVHLVITQPPSSPREVHPRAWGPPSSNRLLVSKAFEL